MRIALLGDPASVVPLLRAISASPAHELIAVLPLTAGAKEQSLLPPGTERCRTWEELLTDRDLAAVVIADDAEASLAAARQLAAAGKTLLLAPRVARAATFIYELSLQQAEQPIPLIPLYALRAHPLAQKLHALVRSGDLGKIEHIRLETRLVPPSSNGTAARLSMDDVAGAFLDDVDLLRLLGGHFDQVTAIRSGDPSSGISLQTITLSGAGIPQAIWTATPSAEPDWRLQAVGDRGTAGLAGNLQAGELTLETRIAGAAPQTEQSGFDFGASQLSLAVAGAETQRVPTWDDFTSAVELFDAVERSIRRRRMIEIHFESQSERGQFKTYMTAAGCSLLSLTLVAVVVYLTTTSLIELPSAAKKILVALIFLPLGLFLALQALIFLARPSTDSKADGSN
jgi:predicted dehydrogenase